MINWASTRASTGAEGSPTTASFVTKGFRYVSPAFRSKQLARQEDGKIAGAIADGTWEKIFGLTAVPTFSELADEYLEECVHRNAPSTVRAKGFHVARLKKEFGNRCIDDVASFHVQTLKRKLAADRSGPTANRHLSTLSGIFKLALQSGYIDRIPTQGIARYPERTDRWTVITRTEFADLVRACPDAPYPGSMSSFRPSGSRDAGSANY